MQNYSLTIASLIVLVLGWLGVSHIATQTEVATTVDNIIQIIGMIGVYIGRYKQGDISVLGVKQ